MHEQMPLTWLDLGMAQGYIPKPLESKIFEKLTG